MKKKFLSIFIALVLVLALVPTVAVADNLPSPLDDCFVSNVNMSGGGYWKIEEDGSLTKIIDSTQYDTYNIKYDESKVELTLKNAHLKNSTSIGAVVAMDGDVITLILEGDSTIECTNRHGIMASNCDLAIKGDGSLTINTTNTDDITTYGIFSAGLINRISITDGANVTCTTNSGDGTSAPKGVETSSLTVDNSSLTAIATGSSNAVGIETDSLTVNNNGKVIAQGGKAFNVTTYTLGTSRMWYGDDEQAAYANGPQSTAPTDYTNIKYAVVGAPYKLEADSATVSVASSNSDNQYPAGAILDIAAQALAGKTFKNWTSSNNAGTFENASLATTKFTMPAADVVLTANYETTASPTTPTNPASGETGAQAGGTATDTKTKTPSTGDSSSAGLYVVLMLLATGGIAGGAVYRKKQIQK